LLVELLERRRQGGVVIRYRRRVALVCVNLQPLRASSSASRSMEAARRRPSTTAAASSRPKYRYPAIARSI
jgi:hypothetical protein